MHQVFALLSCHSYLKFKINKNHNHNLINVIESMLEREIENWCEIIKSSRSGDDDKFFALKIEINIKNNRNNIWN